MVTTQICALLARIEGINIQQLPKYQQTIEENNINGMVLCHCDLDQLKDCLQMKFGDWQLFRSAVEELREVESKAENELDQTEREISSRPIPLSGRDKGTKSVDTNVEYSGSKTGLLRQRSIDTQRDINVDSIGAFDVIQEEDESQVADGRKQPLQRNDSVVAEMMNDSVLLKDLVESFTTENLDEEDEEEETFLPNGNLGNMYQEPQSTPRTFLRDVNFSLSSNKSESNNTTQDEDDGGNSENDPLIVTEEKVKYTPANKNPTPILKMPKLGVSCKGFDKEQENKSSKSEPVLSGSETILVLDEKAPLMRSSTGFLSQDASHSEQKLDTVLVVDETKPVTSLVQNLSLKDSIEQFTMQNAASRKSNKDLRHSFGGVDRQSDLNKEDYL